jgi:predicted aldo/keto reductase-like oxidoreductase
VDLIQLHALVHPDEWDVAMGPGGALEACIEAREQGLLRFIGVTGHGLHDCRHAPAQPGTLRLRLGAAALFATQ